MFDLLLSASTIQTAPLKLGEHIGNQLVDPLWSQREGADGHGRKGNDFLEEEKNIKKQP